ncbi:MAG: hypothetical protein ACRDK9_09455 [Solirubrobacterales bacterium]
MPTTDTSPAGGAEIVEVVIATGGALIATAALLVLGWAHRTGRTDLLRRVAELIGRGAGLAPWAALPAILATGSLLTALLGMYWDISLHIDDGRDAGPLANPAHYLILFGLFGIFAAGFLAIVLPEERPSRGAVRIAGDWYAPLGGIAMLATAGFALLGFPLDDLWHRIFGQDVTLWGPTHLMLIGGAGLTLIGTSALVIEGRAAAPARSQSTGLARRFDALAEQVSRGRRVFAMGGLLIGMSVFQGEFDFGVPQFQLVLHPMLIAFAAGIGLVAARVWLGPGGALGAALFFIVVRGGVALIVGPGFGETTPHLPLYLAEALCVEVAALAIPATRPYLVGAVSGALIGTVGFAAEYGWSHLWMPVPWPETLIGEAVLPTLVVAIAAGAIGAFVGSAFAAGAHPERRRMPTVVPAAAAAVAIAVAVGLNVTDDPAQGVRADVTLSEVTPAPERTVEATVRFDPPTATEDAHWVTALAWQGGEKLAIDHLDEVGPGVYRTTEPLPVHGTYKALIRVHDGNSLAAVPVYLPEDTAIPAEAVPAPPSFGRAMVDETEILQRELKDDVPGYLAGVAYAIVGAIVLAILVLLGWVLVRLGRGAPPEAPAPGARRRMRIGHREAPA